MPVFEPFGAPRGAAYGLAARFPLPEDLAN
jgi:hypothetical protein